MDNTFDFNGNMEFALDHIGAVLLDHTKLMEKFKKKTYKEAFTAYSQTSKPVFEAIERACAVKEEDKTKIITRCVLKAMDDFAVVVQGFGKAKKNSYLETCKMVAALFMVPMIIDLQMDISEEYVDIFMEKWMETYPAFKFKKGTYADLLEGFNKKGFCYITTAVCESQRKQDDCYELMMFRGFRDKFLMKEEEGRVLINQYYELAPRILAAIDMKPEHNLIYEDIWEKHLSVCLSNIEKGQNVLCRKNYENMVYELEHQYIS